MFVCLFIFFSVFLGTINISLYVYMRHIRLFECTNRSAYVPRDSQTLKMRFMQFCERVFEIIVLEIRPKRSYRHAYCCRTALRIAGVRRHDSFHDRTLHSPGTTLTRAPATTENNGKLLKKVIIFFFFPFNVIVVQLFQ